MSVISVRNWSGLRFERRFAGGMLEQEPEPGRLGGGGGEQAVDAGLGELADLLADVGSQRTNQQFLQPWQGGLVLAGYCIAVVAAGTYLATGTDVT